MVPIVTCNSCEVEAKNSDLFCRSCGTEVDQGEDVVMCDCNAIVDEGDKFCHSCGTEFEGEIEEAGDDDDDEDPDDGDDEEDPNEEY